jgi:FkbM family methyltransferase
VRAALVEGAEMLEPIARDQSAAAVQTDLIFDFGLHHGYDSSFYLQKGFRVVGLEAAPAVAAVARARLQPYEEKGLLTLEQKALSTRADETVTFYFVPGKDDWGSLDREHAGKGLRETVEIKVPTTTLAALFDRHGVPYYIKCDLEGADRLFWAQLASQSRRPTFVSVEVHGGGDLDGLRACGYDTFQLINQWMHPFTKCPHPPLEGIFVDAHFNSETSGLFGRELPSNGWISHSEARERVELFKRLKSLDGNLAPGWLDVHACRREALSS